MTEIFHIQTFTIPRYARYANHSAAMLMMMYGDGTGVPIGVIKSVDFGKGNSWQETIMASIKDQKPFKISCSYGPPMPDQIAAMMAAMDAMACEPKEYKEAIEQTWLWWICWEFPHQRVAYVGYVSRPRQAASTYG